MQDFQDRIRKYEEVYETIAQDNLHYVKLIDMVTGRGQMVLNRISGYIPGKIVFFLMQICKYGLAKPRKIWLTRHGESLYNQLGRIGGDSEISPLGRKYASRLADVMMDRIPLTLDGKALPVSVWTSTLKRTIQTAETMPFPKLRWKALDEIQARTGGVLSTRRMIHPADRHLHDSSLPMHCAGGGDGGDDLRGDRAPDAG